MKKQRRKHTAEFKARIAMEAIRGIDTINEITAKYEVHPVQVGNWKKDLLDRVPEPRSFYMSLASSHQH